MLLPLHTWDPRWRIGYLASLIECTIEAMGPFGPMAQVMKARSFPHRASPVGVMVSQVAEIPAHGIETAQIVQRTIDDLARDRDPPMKMADLYDGPFSSGSAITKSWAPDGVVSSLRSAAKLVWRTADENRPDPMEGLTYGSRPKLQVLLFALARLIEAAESYRNGGDRTVATELLDIARVVNNSFNAWAISDQEFVPRERVPQDWELLGPWWAREMMLVDTDYISLVDAHKALLKLDVTKARLFVAQRLKSINHPILNVEVIP